MTEDKQLNTSLAVVSNDPADEEDDVLVQAALQRIQAIHGGAFLAYALEIGDYLLTTFFDGDIARYRKRGNTHASWMALLRHEAVAELGLSGQTLRNYVLAWDVSSTLPQQVRDALPLTHRVRLAALHDPGRRQTLARLAVDKGLSSRALEKEVRREKVKGRKGARRGRPPLPASIKALTQVRGAVGHLTEARKAAGELDDKQRQALLDGLLKCQADLAGVIATLQGGS